MRVLFSDHGKPGQQQQGAKQLGAVQYAGKAVWNGDVPQATTVYRPRPDSAAARCIKCCICPSAPCKQSR